MKSSAGVLELSTEIPKELKVSVSGETTDKVY